MASVTPEEAMGDVVKTTARLATAAGAGELLVAEAAAIAAGIDSSTHELRALELKGKSVATSVVVVQL